MSNVTVSFDAEPHHILDVDGEQYHGGEEFTLDTQKVAELVKANIPLRYDPESLSRSDLEEIAQAQGVDPGEHKSKADLATALSQSTGQPADHTPTVLGVPTSAGAPATPSYQTAASSSSTPESEED